MGNVCNFCINKSQCAECHKWRKDKFIPSDEIKHYFSKGYVGSGGLNGSVYHFNTTNPNLISTHSVKLSGNIPFCPYCGETMFVIQDKETLREIGNCCICEGARAELEYEAKKAAIQKKYEQLLANELFSLECEYKDKLSFCSEKLLEIKQKKERENLKFTTRHNKFSHFTYDKNITEMFE